MEDICCEGSLSFLRIYNQKNHLNCKIFKRYCKKFRKEPTNILLFDSHVACNCVAGYGFVDFESPLAAEGAVKALVAKGIQAQMAKVGIWLLRRLDSVRWLCMQVQ